MFCIVFGLAIGSLGKKAAIFRVFAQAGTAVTMRTLSWAMWYVCIFFFQSLKKNFEFLYSTESPIIQSHKVHILRQNDN